VVEDLIRSERLELPLLSLSQLERLAAGEGVSVGTELGAVLTRAWLDEVGWLAGLRAQQLRLRPVDGPWLLRPILLIGSGGLRTAIGYLNFHGGPDEHGRVEVGYTLLPDARGHGYAIEAVRSSFDWATRVHGVTRFRAAVGPDNERSRNLILKLGFAQTGEQWDEVDGLELVYELG
jgi:GNAT superfamily N-acetyltransferase